MTASLYNLKEAGFGTLNREQLQAAIGALAYGHIVELNTRDQAQQLVDACVTLGGTAAHIKVAPSAFELDGYSVSYPNVPSRRLVDPRRELPNLDVPTAPDGTAAELGSW